MEKKHTADRQYRFHLYISGPTARSRHAVMNIKEICDQHLEQGYDLQITDIYQNPEQVAADNIVAVPTLIKKNPLPVRRFVGDLSDTARVISGLAIKKTA